MKKKDKIWLLSWPLRISMGLCTLAFFSVFMITWWQAINGETELAFDIVDIDGDYPLHVWQLTIGVICTSTFVASLMVMFLSINSFLHTVQTKGFFVKNTSKHLKHLGYGTILFWLDLVVVDTICQWALTKNLEPDLQVPLEWLPFDSEIVALILGFVLILMSKALDEARIIDQDYKQII